MQEISMPSRSCDDTGGTQPAAKVSTRFFHGDEPHLETRDDRSYDPSQGKGNIVGGNIEDDVDAGDFANRLDFSELTMRGREEELDKLYKVYNQVQREGEETTTAISKPKEEGQSTPATGSSKDASSVVMIHGLSGTGKSTLVKQFIQDLIQRSKHVDGPTKPHFLGGKYDELSGGDPFSAISEACSGFATSLLDHETPEEVQRIRTAVQDALGEEAKILSTVIPNLQTVISDDDNDNDVSNNKNHESDRGRPPESEGSKENAFNRLKYIFQLFANAISSKERPVIMFLDDLQWCDSASLELIQTLLTDNDLRHFMFIGAYRSDEAKEHAELIERLQNIENTQEVQHIELKNLSWSELNEFIGEVLKSQPERTKSLTDVIHTRSGGNLFYSMQVMEELNRKGLLLFSRVTFEWEWNLSGVNNVDDLLSDDVIASVTSKIKAAPDLVQKVLIVAAYTRSTVDIDTMRQLLELEGTAVESDVLLQLLEKAVLDGLLANSMGSNSYSFAHDRIQQAAYAMVPSGQQRDRFRLRMGRYLYEIGSSNAGEDWMLFAAADHLNATSFQLVTQEHDPLFLARINLKVGERASKCFAFETASKFLGLGLQSLLKNVQNPWETEYDMTLKVYQAFASVELCQGHFEIGFGLANRILQHAETPEDKLRIQVSLTKALGREKRHKESFDTSAKALHALRQYPKGYVGVTVGVLKDMQYIKRYFKTHTNEDILNLPVVKDRTLASIMDLFASFSYQAYMCGRKFDHLAITLRMLRITFKHGLFHVSGAALIGYTLVLDWMNDSEGVTRLSRLTRDVLKVTKAKELECLLLFVLATYIHAWKDPHSEIISIYERAEKLGMESGDFENALLSRFSCISYECLVGFRLQELYVKHVNLVEKLGTFNLRSIHYMVDSQLLLMDHLMGKAKSPVDFKTFLAGCASENNESDNYVRMFVKLRQIQLGVYYGNHPYAQKCLEELGAVNEASYAINSYYLFFGSITYSTLARDTRKKAYIKKSKKSNNKFESLIKTKGMKCRHRYLLAEAHLQSSSGKSSTSIQAMYDRAIKAAIDSGFIHDAALGSQLAAEYYLSMRDDFLGSVALSQARDKLVGRYLIQAREFYLDWGAKGLVRHLEQTHSNFLSASSPVDGQASAGASCGKTFNSMDLDSECTSLPSPPDMVPKTKGKSNDDVSAMTDQSPWRQAKELTNPHTEKGDFPVEGA